MFKPLSLLIDLVPAVAEHTAEQQFDQSAASEDTQRPYHVKSARRGKTIRVKQCHDGGRESFH